MNLKIEDMLMPNVSFPAPGTIAHQDFSFSVILPRFRDKWIYCRHKDRNTWEIPGGHIEPDETPDAAAARELKEETGAKAFTLIPVSPYAVEEARKVTFGMLYLSQVDELQPLSENSEMAEIGFFERAPEQLTYPAIQPQLYTRVQNYLNLQSSADELWDVYDKDRRLTGRAHRRGDLLNPGEYHLCVEIWQQNSQGEFLITRRAPNKGFPLMWETTGGSALMGDDSLTAALREVKEETGLTLLPENGKLISTTQGSDWFKDVWFFRQDADIRDVVLQEGETCDARYASIEEILALQESGEMVSYPAFEKMLGIIKKYEDR